MEQEQSSELESKEVFYREHVLKAQGGELSVREYCKQNGLSIYAFNHHKKAMGLMRERAKPNPPKAFVKVEAQATEMEPKIASRITPRVRNHELPDPKWLAQFLHAYVVKR
jgi:hypothetical protein